MRSALLHVLAWTLATGAAVTLSWWGVHTVMAGTVYDPPRALPLAVGEADSATREAEPPPSPSPSRTASKSPATPSAPTTPAPAASPTPSRTAVASTPSGSGSAEVSGTVKSYDTDGGRVVLDLTETYATLVSATPGPNWSVQVWKTESWIRVDFASGADRVTVFCTWHDGPPRVDVQNY
ncbi:hypothetical protein ABZ725_26960 [Streptomyces sp. NPDC006872]|uniref:hypothetical protein n=1 Tax=Streptomyces sp. NPDC006872 TaxID=3155720 RepID=UPI0033D59C8F